MADIRLGGAVVEVSLDMKKAQEQAAAFGKSVPLQKSVVAEEKKKASAVKATSDAIDEQTKKIRDLLGIQATAARAATTSAASVVGGVKSGSTKAMMGAQITYALQDLLTGASMGNMNQALLGMSNNLSMIAMLWGGISGTITSVAVAALPLLYTGMKAFINQERESKEAVDALTAAFERQKFAMQLLAIARQGLTAQEVGRMRNADHVQAQIEAEQNAIRKLDAAINDHRKSIQGAESVLKGRSAGSFSIKPGDDELVAKHARLVEDFAKQQAKFPGARLLAAEGELQRSMDAIAKKYGVTLGMKPGQFQAISTREGVEFVKSTTAEERQKAAIQKGEASAEMTKLDAEKKKAEADSTKLTERRNELLRRDLGFMQRTANAGFNNYERAKIDLERKQAQERQELRDKGFGNIPLGPRMTEEDRKKRIDESDKAERDELDANIKAMQERGEKNRIHGRNLSKKELKEFEDNATEIMSRRAKERDKINKEFEQGPGTLLDPAMKALKTEQARERALLAQKFAGQGQGPGSYVSMEGLNKFIQSHAGGDKGMDFAQQTAGNTKSIAESQRDLLEAVKELNLGFGP